MCGMQLTSLSTSKTARLMSYVSLDKIQCRLTIPLIACLDDPALWHNAPIGLQIISKHFEDERLLAISEVIDSVVNDKN
jgi:Asp-tRNA(Asn)/Glu-tRNA(Gln) amidotransferase A subunit family amidase